MTPLSISYRSILSIALPLSLGAFVQFLVVLTDNYFLSRVSENSINGAGNGGLLYITAIMLGVGLGGGTQILIARRNGSGDFKNVGIIFGTSLRISIVAGAVCWLIFRGLDQYAFQYWLKSDDILKTMREFMDIRTFGFFVYIPTLIINSLYMGIGKTRILTISMGLLAGLNIVLDWLLIFGNAGFPAMGHQGAALGTLIAEIGGLVFIAIYTWRTFRNHHFELWKGLTVLNAAVRKQIISLSLPLVVQQILALATWSCFYFLVEKVGSTPLKISHIVRNGYLLAFVAIMGISQTTRTIVSTLIAQNRQRELRLAIKRLMTINLIGAFILCHWMIFYPQPIAALFFESLADQAQLSLTFRIVFFAIMMASLVLILLNIIEGSGKTKAGMFIELTCISIYLVFVYLTTVYSEQPIHIIWMTDYIYFGALGLISILYLRRSNWRYNTI